jgi:hypothetical protein
MIFLAVSAAMFVSIAALISGRQQRAEFSQAVGEFQTKLQDIANDVSAGYYANATSAGDKVRCDAAGGNPQLHATNDDDQGANKECIFIGKSIQFAPQNSNRVAYNVIPLVGSRSIDGDTSKGDATNIDESNIVAIAPSPSSAVDATELINLHGGLTVECVLYSNASVTPPDNNTCTAAMTKVDVVTFLTTFTGTSGQNTGASQVDIVVAGSSPSPAPLDRLLSSAVSEVNGYHESPVSNIVKNPKSGVFICLQSGGTNQHVVINLGGENSQFSANTKILDGKC